MLVLRRSLLAFGNSMFVGALACALVACSGAIEGDPLDEEEPTPAGDIQGGGFGVEGTPATAQDAALPDAGQVSTDGGNGSSGGTGRDAGVDGSAGKPGVAEAGVDASTGQPGGRDAGVDASTGQPGRDAGVDAGGGTGGQDSGSDAAMPDDAGAPSGWVLAWSDEFNGTGLVNTNDWGYEVGRVRNNEAQYYTRADLDNAHMEGGNLVLTAVKESFSGAAYTSASITTQGKRQFSYGRLEVRAKIPVARGTWPAIWLLGIRDSWPKCGEIDVMESVGFESSTIHATIHTGADPSGQHNGATNIDGLADKFLVYALEWSTTKLDFYVDGKLIFSYANDGAGDVNTWPFSQPAYLILNLAIGGSWGGQQGIDDAVFPHHYYIDYVRYYTKP